MTDTQRVNIGEQHPAAYKTLIALSSEVGEAAAAAGLDPLLVELLRIRTSQINGCAFCLRMHTRDALRKGENPDRIAGCLPLPQGARSSGPGASCASRRAGGYVKARSRRLLVTTKTDEKAIAAPAIIGLSMPNAARGRAATL